MRSVDDTPKADTKQQRPKLVLQLPSSTTCLITILATVSFAVGGLLGGIAGGGLVLWASGGEASLWQRLLETPTVDVVLRTTPTLQPTDTRPVLTLTPTPTPTRQATDTPIPSPTATPTVVPTPSIAEGVSRALPAVVTVVNHQSGLDGQGIGLDTRVRGSGTIVDPRGYVATSYHVVQGASELTIILDTGQALIAQLVAFDAQMDIALVRVDGDDMPAATWGDSEAVQLGQWAIAIGSALGDFPSTVTVGVISGLGRSLEMDDNVTIDGLIQTDAAINKGNSGGPLVNQHGEVIGINTFIIRENRQSGVAEGLGFAIPSSLARDMVDQWIAADTP